jgi:LysR family transcriptional regulator of gallate degradation
MSDGPVSPPEAEQQLQNLHVFICVADAKSIAGAAKRIFKAPSAITRSILALERSMGVSLFERKPRGMLLNAYGEVVLLRARRIQYEIQLAADEFLRSNGKTLPSSQSAIGNLLFSSHKLQLLIRLADLRNISTAATQMSMTQAGASMALARIEAVLGQPLFQRRMQGMIPTEAAEQLIMRARRVFAELRHMVSDVSAISGALAGTVVIGATPLGRTEPFTSAVAGVVTRHPELQVTSVESLYDPLISGLRSGDIDIVFGVLRPTHLSHGLITERLFTDRLCVVARAGHPLARRKRLQMPELIAERWILPRPNALARPQFDSNFRQLGLEPPVPSIETGDLSIVRQLLCVSDLLAVTSPYQISFELRSGLIVELPVKFSGESREVGFIVREGAMLSPAALAVLDAVRHQVMRT